MYLLLILFVFFVGGGWLIGRIIGGGLEKMFTEKKDNITFIDKSVHNHYHEHKNISIIDEGTKKKIFELKESKETKK